MNLFDENYWVEAIKKPDWYMDFVPYVKEMHAILGKNGENIDKFNYIVRHFFEKALQAREVSLADKGPNLDEQREPVDTVVIHHTSNKPGYQLSYMNAVHLLNIYATYFYDPRDEREKDLKGQPIWSNHLRNGQPSFLAYHWLMRMDGNFEQLLDDSQIGWHAGNWDINKRSVAICLDNDYETQDPTDDILQKLAAHIKQYYPDIKPPNIIGHCEARSGTTCPGSNFLTVWKPKLIKMLTN